MDFTRHLLSYLILSFAIYVARALHGMTPVEVFAAFFWPVVYILIFWLLTTLEEDGV